jgi:hypothetical protein
LSGLGLLNQDIPNDVSGYKSSSWDIGAGSIRSGSLSAEVVSSGDNLPGSGKSGDWDRWINVHPSQKRC